MGYEGVNAASNAGSAEEFAPFRVLIGGLPAGVPHAWKSGVQLYAPTQDVIHYHADAETAESGVI